MDRTNRSRSGQRLHILAGGIVVQHPANFQHQRRAIVETDESGGKFRVELALAHKLGSAVATTDTDAKLRGWAQAIMEF